MKKLSLYVFLTLLLVTSKAFSKEGLYWCQYEHANLFVEEGEPWGIPVSIIPEENKINFLKEFNSSDGVKWPSMVYKKRFFKINEKNENFYKASGPWDDVDKRIVDVVFERENNRLLYKFEGLDYISIFFCTNN